jgi:hypothetical protein
MNEARSFYPGMYIYAALFCVSAFCFILWPQGSDVTGFLMVLWGGFALLRALWILDVLHFVERPQKTGMPLPQRILRAMQNQRDDHEARQAAGAVTGPLMALFLLIALYVLGCFYMFYQPLVPQSFVGINALIAGFFSGEDLHIALGRVFDIQAQFAHLGRVVVIALAFWIAQTYAREARDIVFLLRVSLVIFCAVFFFKLLQAGMPHFAADPALSWRGQGWENIEILQRMAIYAAPLSCMPARILATGISVVFLYAAGFVTALIFARAVLAGQRRNGLIGLGILSVFLYADLAAPCTAWGPAFWLAGWVALALLMSRFDRRLM